MIHHNFANIQHEFNQLLINQPNESNKYHKILNRQIVNEWLEITSVECLFNNFSNQLDNYFKDFPNLNGKSLKITELLTEMSSVNLTKLYNQQKMSNLETETVWKWLKKLTKCLESHLNNASLYYQFQNKMHLCNEGVAIVQAMLRSNLPRQTNRLASSLVNSTSNMLQDLVNKYHDYLLIMINMTEITGELLQQYLNISPIRQRTTMEYIPQAAQLLADLCLSNIVLTEQDNVTVVHKDLHSNLWTVQLSDASQVEVPSIFLSLKGYDRQIVNNCTKLKSCISNLWKSFNESFHRELMDCLKRNCSDFNSQSIFDPKLITPDVQLILSKLQQTFQISPSDFPSMTQFLVNPSNNNDKNNVDLVNEAIQYYNDSALYSLYYDNMSTAFNYREECMVAVNKPRYVTMAYISNIPEDVATEMELTRSQSIHKPQTNSFADDDKTNIESDLISEMCVTPIEDESSSSSSSSSPLSTRSVSLNTTAHDHHLSPTSCCTPNTTTTTPQLNSSTTTTTTTVQQPAVYKQTHKRFVATTDKISADNNVVTTVVTNYSSSYRFYLHESNSCNQQYHSITLVKPSHFVALPSYIQHQQPDTDNLLIRDYHNGIIVCDAVNTHHLMEQQKYTLLLLAVNNSGKFLSIEESVKAGILNVDYGTVLDTGTGKHVSLREALHSNLLKSCEIPSEMLTPEFYLKYSEASKSTHFNTENIKWVYDTSKEIDVTKEEALDKGLLFDSLNWMFCDVRKQKWMTLDESIDDAMVVELKNGETFKRLRVSKVDCIEGELDSKLIKEIELKEAKSMGIIDQRRDRYGVKHLEIKLLEAVKQGWITTQEEGEDYLVVKWMEDQKNEELAENLFKSEAKITLGEILDTWMRLGEWINEDNRRLEKKSVEELMMQENDRFGELFVDMIKLERIEEKVPMSEAMEKGLVAPHTKLIVLHADDREQQVELCMCVDAPKLIDLRCAVTGVLNKLIQLDFELNQGVESCVNDDSLNYFNTALDTIQLDLNQFTNDLSDYSANEIGDGDDANKLNQSNCDIEQQNIEYQYLTNRTDEARQIIDNVKALLQNRKENLTNQILDQDNLFNEVKLCDKVIKCKNQDTADYFTTVIYALDNEGQIIYVADALKGQMLNMDAQSVQLNNQAPGQYWKEAIENENLLAFELDDKMITDDLIESVLASLVDKCVGEAGRLSRDYQLVDFYNTEECQALPLSLAGNSKLYDEQLMIARDTAEDKWLSIQQSIDRGVLCTVQSERAHLLNYAHRLCIQSVYISTNEKASLPSAIHLGVVDVLEQKYQLNYPPIEISLLQAVQCGLVEIGPIKTQTGNNWLTVCSFSDQDPEIYDLQRRPYKDPRNLFVLSLLLQHDKFHFKNVPYQLWIGEWNLDPLSLSLWDPVDEKLWRELSRNFPVGDKSIVWGWEIKEIDKLDQFVVKCKTMFLQSCTAQTLRDDRLYLRKIVWDNVYMLRKMAAEGIDVLRESIECANLGLGKINLASAMLGGLFDLNGECGWQMNGRNILCCVEDGLIDEKLVEEIDNWLDRYQGLNLEGLIRVGKEDLFVNLLGGGECDEDEQMEEEGKEIEEVVMNVMNVQHNGELSRACLSKYLPRYRHGLQLGELTGQIGNVSDVTLILGEYLGRIALEKALEMGMLLGSSLVQIVWKDGPGVNNGDNNSLVRDVCEVKYRDSLEYLQIVLEFAQVDKMMEDALQLDEVAMKSQDLGSLLETLDSIQRSIVDFKESPEFCNCKEEKLQLIDSKLKMLQAKFEEIKSRHATANVSLADITRFNVELEGEDQVVCLSSLSDNLIDELNLYELEVQEKNALAQLTNHVIANYPSFTNDITSIDPTNQDVTKDESSCVLVILAYRDESSDLYRTNTSELQFDESNHSIINPNGSSVVIVDAIDNKQILTVLLPEQLLNHQYIKLLQASIIQARIQPELLQNILAILDTQNDCYLSLHDAIEENIFNHTWNLVVDTSNNQLMTLQQAVEVQKAIGYATELPDTILLCAAVDSIKVNGNQASALSLSEAKHQQYIIENSTKFVNSDCALQLPIIDAIKIGLIELLSKNQLHNKDILPIYLDKSELEEENSLLPEWLFNYQEYQVVNLRSFVLLNQLMDLTNGEQLSDLVKAHTVELDPMRIEHKSILLMSQPMSTLEKSISVLNSNMVGFNQLDLPEIVSNSQLKDFIIQQNRQPDHVYLRVYVLDCTTGDIMSVYHLLSQTIVSDKSEDFIKVKYLTRFGDIQQFTRMIKLINFMSNHHFDMNMPANLMEAIFIGQMNLDTVQLMGTDSEQLNLDECRDVLGDANVDKIKESLYTMQFERLIDEQKYSMDTNKFIADNDEADDKQAEYSLAQAMSSNLLDTDLVYLPHIYNGELGWKNLGSMLDQNTVDPHNNTIRNNNADQPINEYLYNLHQSMSASVNPSSNQIQPLSEIMALIDPTANPLIQFNCANQLSFDHIIPIGSALQDGYITGQSLVQPLFNNSQELLSLVYCDNEAIVEFIDQLNYLQDKLTNPSQDGKRSLPSISSELEAIEFNINEYLIMNDDALHSSNQLETAAQAPLCPPQHLDILNNKLNQLKSTFKKAQIDSSSQQNLLRASESRQLLNASNVQLCEPQAIIDELNKVKLHLNDNRRQLERMYNSTKACDTSKIPKSQLLEDINKLEGIIHELVDEMPNQMLAVREMLQKNLRGSTVGLEDGSNNKNSQAERYFVEVRNFKEELEQMALELKARLQKLTGESLAIDKSLGGLRAKYEQLLDSFINECESQKCPLKLKLSDALIHKIAKHRRDAKALLLNLDRFEKGLPGDFKDKPVYKHAREVLKALKTDVEVGLLGRILDHQKLLEDTKVKLAEIKSEHKVLSEMLDGYCGELEGIREELREDYGVEDGKKKMDNLEKLCQLRKKMVEPQCMDRFDRLEKECKALLDNPQIYSETEGLNKMIETLIPDQHKLYSAVNEEIIDQIESAISEYLVEITGIQTVIGDFPKYLSILPEEVQLKISELKKCQEYLIGVDDQLCTMDQKLAQDMNEHLPINYELVDQLMDNIQSCNKERQVTTHRLDSLMKDFANPFSLLLNMFVERHSEADQELIQLNQDWLSLSKSPDSMDQEDLTKCQGQLSELDGLIESVDTCGHDLIELLMQSDRDLNQDQTEQFCVQLQNQIDELHGRFDQIKQLYDSLRDQVESTDQDQQNQPITERLVEELDRWKTLLDAVNLKLNPIESKPSKLVRLRRRLSDLTQQVKLDNARYCSQLRKESMDTVSDSDNSSSDLMELDPLEVKSLVAEIDAEIEKAEANLKSKEDTLNSLENLAQQFWPKLDNMSQSIRNIKKEVDNLQAFPKLEEQEVELEDDINEEQNAEVQDLEFSMLKPEIVRNQRHRAEELGVQLQQCAEKLSDQELYDHVHSIVNLGGESCQLEITNHLDTLHDQIETTQDVVDDKKHDLDSVIDLIDSMLKEGQTLLNWFNDMDQLIQRISELPPDQKLTELKLMEFKMLTNQAIAKTHDVDNMIKMIDHLLQHPNVPQHDKLTQLKSLLTEKSQNITDTLLQSQNELQQRYIAMGELDTALEDNIGVLQELENQLKQLTPERYKGDVDYTKSCLANVKTIAKAFSNLQPIISDLQQEINQMKPVNDDATEDAILLRSRGAPTIFAKSLELAQLNDTIHQMIPEKISMMEDQIKYEKSLAHEIQRHISFLESTKQLLKEKPKLSYHAAAANQVINNYKTCFDNIAQRHDDIIATIDNAAGLLDNNQPGKSFNFNGGIRQLTRVYAQCKELAERRQQQLNELVNKINALDKSRNRLFEEIDQLEALSLRKLNPSKITVTCAGQIDVVKKDISHADQLTNQLSELINESSAIRCYTNSIDNTAWIVSVNEYKLKLGKIQKCLRQRLRIFNQAYKEDKLFSDSYDDLNNWLDRSYETIESFKEQQVKVMEHLDKLKSLCKQLSAQYANFHCTVRYGSYLKDRCTSDDPERAILLDMLLQLKVKWNKIRGQINTEKVSINRKIIETGSLLDAINCVEYWLKELKDKFHDRNSNIYGDIDTVEILVNDCQVAQSEADSHQIDFARLRERMLQEIDNYKEENIREKLEQVDLQLKEYYQQLERRLQLLQTESIPLADSFKSGLDQLQYQLTKYEKMIGSSSNIPTSNTMTSYSKSHSKSRASTDPSDLINQIEKHENFLQSINDTKVKLQNWQAIGQSILEQIHPLAKNYVTKILANIQRRFNNINKRAESKTKKLNECLGSFRGSAALIEELIQLVAEQTNEINLLDSNNQLPSSNTRTKELSDNEVESSLAEQITNTEQAINQHKIVHDSLQEIDGKIKTLLAEFKHRGSNPSNIHKTGLPVDRKSNLNNVWRNSRDSLTAKTPSDDVSSNSRLNLLNSQFNNLWKMSVQRKTKLQDQLKHLQEREQLRQFDFNAWRLDFLAYVKTKGLRLTDIFRKATVAHNGYLTADEFCTCMMRTGYPTSPAILQQVFVVFDRQRSGLNAAIGGGDSSSGQAQISYQEFIDSLKSDRKTTKCEKPTNLVDKKDIAKFIHDTIEREVASCCCTQRFMVKKEADNKYRFGNNNKLYMVRYLNSVVMVRIGGGWQTLTDFLRTHDPCRASNINPSSDITAQQQSSAAPSTNQKASRAGVIKTGLITATNKSTPKSAPPQTSENRTQSNSSNQRRSLLQSVSLTGSASGTHPTTSNQPHHCHTTNNRKPTTQSSTNTSRIPSNTSSIGQYKSTNSNSAKRINK